MITVKQILEDKQGETLTAAPEDDLNDALKIMAKNNIGALVVVKNDKVVGVFSERDFVRNAAKKGIMSESMVVEQLMSPVAICVSPEQTLDECMELMTRNRTRHLPVLEGGKLVGIVSIGDVLKHTIEEKKLLIQNLENYISGSL